MHLSSVLLSTSLVLNEVSLSGIANEATYANYLKCCVHKSIVLQVADKPCGTTKACVSVGLTPLIPSRLDQQELTQMIQQNFPLDIKTENTWFYSMSSLTLKCFISP